MLFASSSIRVMLARLPGQLPIRNKQQRIGYSPSALSPLVLPTPLCCCQVVVCGQEELAKHMADAAYGRLTVVRDRASEPTFEYIPYPPPSILGVGLLRNMRYCSLS